MMNSLCLSLACTWAMRVMISDLTEILLSQANKTHPYYRYGYSLALGVGLVAGVYALTVKKEKPQQAPSK